MLFDQPRELPIATIRSTRTPLAISLSQWLAARWSWLRPRMVPVLVAAIGMVLVLNAVNYLAHPPAAPIAASAAPAAHVKVVLQQ
jgi:hypothetical protein